MLIQMSLCTGSFTIRKNVFRGNFTLNNTVINPGGRYLIMKKTILWSMLAFLSFVMFGCGSGDFSLGGGTTISGMASKGPITGGKVAIFAVTSSGHIGTTPLATAIPQSGSFSANLGSYKGAIFATMSGGAYVSEAATGANANSQVLLQQKIRAATYISQSGPVNLAITPLTEVAFRQMSSSGGLTQTVIESANASVTSSYLKGLSAGNTIVNTLPANILKNAATTSTNADQINYALALATICQMMEEVTGTTATLENVIQTLQAQNTSATNAYTSAFTNLSSANLQTNIKVLPLNVTLTTTSSSVTGGVAGSGSVSLTATVTGFAGVKIADNTPVTFKVVSGSGALSAASAVTTGGAATVTISSSVVGTVGVSATAGTAVSSTLSVPFAENPNDPGSVTLSSSSTSAEVGSPMTLTANVGVVGGGTVTAGSPPSSPVTVTFTITHGSGTLSSVSAPTDPNNGNATVTLNSATAGNITLSATAGTSPVITSNPITVAFTPNPAAPATVTVSASSTSSPADGSTPVTFTIAVTNYTGTALPSVPLAISNTGVGTLGTAPTATDSTGKATVTLTSSTVGMATVSVTATAAGVTATGTAQVSFTTPAARPTTATVKLLTSGTLASGTKIGSIQATLTYPATLSVSSTSPPVASGVGASGLFEANSATSGAVTLGLVSSSGITTGEFATVTFTIPTSGTLPVSGDFAIASGATVTDVNGATLSGISVITTFASQ